TPREYELKAVWLYNLLKFVDWPPDVLPPQSEAFTIGILGESQFGEALDRLQEKTIKGKKILVKHLAGPSDGRDCQIIFICVSEKERLPQILETLKRTRVLTVGETAGFAEEGGIANLIAERNRVRLEINNSAASRSGLTISSQLLNVAKLVES
ncbi:MAG TPA: YfiR family protein, partial [Verrucomicrobiae bacterium]|nr:YfiR family protein [Verrucomicrobiae bacterium]